MKAVINDPRGFIDCFWGTGAQIGQDPRPGLEWYQPVILNGEVGTVIGGWDDWPDFLLVQFWEWMPPVLVRRKDLTEMIP